MGRVLGFVLVLALLVGAGVGGWSWWETRQAEASLDALPALTKENSTRAYLDGTGKVVRAMFDLTPELVADEGSCADRVRTLLPPLGTPNELSEAASDVPDPTARDVALAHVGMLTDYAASCNDGGDGVEVVGDELVMNRATFEELMAEEER